VVRVHNRQRDGVLESILRLFKVLLKKKSEKKSYLGRKMITLNFIEKRKFVLQKMSFQHHLMHS
jgi:hypothetical protein